MSYKQLRIRTLELSGTPYEMGVSHGRAYLEDIRHYTAERVQLVCDGGWSGGAMPRTAVLDLAEQCLPHHQAYAPDLYAEMRGIADATGLTLAELLIVGGFTDFVDTVYSASTSAHESEFSPAIDDCTAFLVPPRTTAVGAGFFGQTWDMHDTAVQYVTLLHLQTPDKPEAFVFTTAGCVGQIGLNAHGICVGINNLQGADGQQGVTWPFVVRKILQQDNLADALDCITQAGLAGAHNYLLMDKHGRGYNVEAMPTHCHITPLADEPLVHTNHCLFPETNARAQTRPPEAQASSEARLARAQQLLRERPLTLAQLMAITRDEQAICHIATPPLDIETCGAVIAQPSSGDFWAVWGLPSHNNYQRFCFGQAHQSD